MWNVDTEWKVKTAPQNHVWSVTLAISSTSCTACNCTKCWLIQIYLAVLVLTNSNLPLGNEPLMPSKAFSPACKMLLVALNCIFFLFRNALSAAPKALFCALKYTFSCTEAFFFFLLQNSIYFSCSRTCMFLVCLDYMATVREQHISQALYALLRSLPSSLDRSCFAAFMAGKAWKEMMILHFMTRYVCVVISCHLVLCFLFSNIAFNFVHCTCHGSIKRHKRENWFFSYM